MLKNDGLISEKIYKAIFRKGLVNNLPDKLKSIMLPKKDGFMALPSTRDQKLAQLKRSRSLSVRALPDEAIAITDRLDLKIPVRKSTIVDKKKRRASI